MKAVDLYAAALAVNRHATKHRTAMSDDEIADAQTLAETVCKHSGHDREVVDCDGIERLSACLRCGD